MEIPSSASEVFLFSAQQNLKSTISEEFGLNLGVGESSKHARAEFVTVGRNDVDAGDSRRESIVQTTTDKEDSPFGPWLLVSYGKQVSRNYKGKPWKAGNGNANFVARNGIAKNGPENNIRSGLDSNSRKMDGEFTEWGSLMRDTSTTHQLRLRVPPETMALLRPTSFKTGPGL
ncbi:hypothetical protein Q3G72_003613 [Acer saccharum]|nr:hypothetical protein Q3G72_003613 [Acer saccharum]